MAKHIISLFYKCSYTSFNIISKDLIHKNLSQWAFFNFQPVLLNWENLFLNHLQILFAKDQFQKHMHVMFLLWEASTIFRREL